MDIFAFVRMTYILLNEIYTPEYCPKYYRLVFKEEKMEIIDFNDDYLNYIVTCTHSNKKNLIENETQEIRKQWIFKNLKNGLIIKIAVHDQKPLGFIHAYPVELSCELEGSNYYTIPCLAVNYQNIYSQKTGSGIGRKLIKSIEDEVFSKTNGIAVIGHDNNFWFMPFGFFMKVGFKEASRIGQRVLLVKKFNDKPVPSFGNFEYQFHKKENKTVIDYFWNSMCPTVIQEYLNIKNFADGNDDIILNEYNCDKCVAGLKHPRALFINGKLINLEDTLSDNKIRDYLKTKE